MAKAYAAQAAMRVCADAVQILRYASAATGPIDLVTLARAAG